MIVSSAPFTVKVNRDGTALTASNGSYTVDNVTVGSTVALGVDFTPNEYGLTVDESKITSRWYYKNESKTAADGKALTLNNIQYGVYDLIFEAKESTYGFTTSVSVTVNVNPPEEKTAISLKTQLTSDEYTKVYDGTTKASEILPPIEFQLADEREIRIPRLVISMFNRDQFQTQDFTTDFEAVYLSEKGRRKVLEQWRARKHESIQHPFLKEKVPIGMIPYVQSMLFARVLRRDLDRYPPFVWRS